MPSHDRDGGWWRVDRRTRGPAPSMATFRVDDDVALPDPRSPSAAAGSARRIGASSTTGASSGPTGVADGSACPWPCWLRAAPRDLQPRGTPATVRSAARAPRGPRRDAHRGAPVTDSAATATGATTASPVHGARGLRRSDGVSSGSSTRATRRGSRVIQDVVYNHLGPSGNHLARFGPYLRDVRATPGVNRSTSTRPAGARLHRRQRAACGCATTTWTVCGSMPCTPCTTRPVHILEELARASDALAARPRPPAEPRSPSPISTMRRSSTRARPAATA